MREQLRQEADERNALQQHVKQRVVDAVQDWRTGARQRLADELAAAVAVGVGKSELARLTELSRPSVYELLAEAGETSS